MAKPATPKPFCTTALGIGHLEDLRDHQIPIGLLFVDIDRFKRINDNLGHQIGGEVLKMGARTMANAVRSSFDLVCRWGKEEFTVLLLNVDRSHSARIGEKLRFLAEQSGIRQDSRFVRTTISLGGMIAQSGDPGRIEQTEAWIVAALEKDVPFLYNKTWPC
jgi:diguanylate cyclase (GGDEF)-like protein